MRRRANSAAWSSCGAMIPLRGSTSARVRATAQMERRDRRVRRGGNPAGRESRRLSQPCLRARAGTATTRRAIGARQAVRRGGAGDARCKHPSASVCWPATQAADYRARARASVVRRLSADRGVVPLHQPAAALGGDVCVRRLFSEGVAAHPHGVAPEQSGRVLDAGEYVAAAARGGTRHQEDAGIPQCTRTRRLALPRGGDEALECYLRATKTNPDPGGDAHQARQHPLASPRAEEAVRCWERALELDPDNAIVRTNLESVRQVL